MSFDLSSWLWWKLVSLLALVLVWLLLAFGVRATPVPAHVVLGQQQAPAQSELEAARQPFAGGPCEGRLETTARRFKSQSAPQSALAMAVPRLQGRL